MRHMWKKFAVLSASGVFAVVSTAAAAQTRVTVGGGPLGGTFYVVASGFAKILNDFVPSVEASVEVNAGSSHNVQLVNSGDVDFGLTNGSVLLAGIEGTGWADGTKHEDVTLLFGSQLSYVHFWTPASTGITSFDDLEGRIVNLSARGSGADITGRRLLEALEVEPGSITNLGHNDANQAMQDGLVEAALTAGGVPHPAVAAFTSTRDAVIFGVEGENAERFRETAPALVVAEIPPGTYEGQTSGVPTLGDWNVFIAHKDLPEELVYELMKATFDNIDTWIAVHQSARETRPENISDLLGYPIHPGAERFYREMGLM